MQNGGAWMGFHVSAFTTDASSWSWYYNTFLGSGNFATNTWGPTAETLRITPGHPSTAGLPATIPSAISEWYSWGRDLRQNPDIDILASVDAGSFPVGTDPDQQWRSGFYPLIWTNRAGTAASASTLARPAPPAARRSSSTPATPAPRSSTSSCRRAEPMYGSTTAATALRLWT
jgi:hypothetical protein